MSTPVVSRSTVTAMPGFGRLRNSRIFWSGRSTRPVIFSTNESPLPNTSRATSTSWSACDVCGRSFTAKKSVFGNRPWRFSCSSAYFFTSSTTFRFDSGDVTVRSAMAFSTAAFASR